jgi:hypothetical protein
MQAVLFLKYKATARIAPFELVFIFHPANDAPFEPPHPNVVVQLLSDHSDSN